ncbi:hypothetical protein C7C46_31100 [Streptomyces tateyamensis]|uniref:DUF881 domain-containing protein n=2 Tax=Streptomyces tateyamensis TaxID=565073 RepID=A0A2V4NI98_9ACTN|nr:hypothetical protein C7C46_31100 [Streptomyces tateyamensis]
MTLLTTMMDQSLDEGYAAAARARGEVGRRRLPTTTRGKLLLGAGLAMAAVVVTISGVNAHDARPELAKEHDALVQRVTDATAAADKLQHQVESARAQVDAEQQKALHDGVDSGLASLDAAVGTGAVTGPGVKLVIDDPADAGTGGGIDPRTSGGFSGGRLRDRDLQLVVNGLWQAGAEAVAVNGQRLTALSPIRAAGDAILVDNRPLVPPYTVLAIGDEKVLPAAFQESMGGHYLKLLQDSYGIRANLSGQHALSLPAAVGFALRLASPLPDTPGTGAPSAQPSGAPATSTPLSPSASPSPSPTSGTPAPSRPSRTGASKS